MTIAIRHSKVVAIPDDGTSPVGSDEWNANHVITGLENVDNTSDANKPVSTAQQAAINAGVASVTKASIGLGNADNTSDANKPVSTAQAAADATVAANAANASNLTSGTVPAARMPALTGDVTMAAGTTATTLASGNAGNLNSGTLLAARLPALTGDVTTVAGAVATTIANNAVTNAKAAQMAANTIKGNNTGASANATDLNGAQVEQMLLFTQTGTGAVQRSLDSKIKEFVSVKDFGAVGDGATNDSAAFQAAFTSSGYVEIPPGTYVLNSTITISNKAVFVRGSGMETTILKFAASTNGFVISQNSGTFPVSFRDLTIATLNDPATQSATAVSVTWPTGWADRFRLKGLMLAVEFRGYDVAANGWTNGVSITQGLNFVWEYCNFIGKDAGQPANPTQATTTVSTSAIVWTGGWYPTDFKVSHSYFYAWQTGVSVGGATEGVSILDTTFVYLYSGVVWQVGNFDAGLGGGSAAGRPLLLVRGSHFNVLNGAIFTNGAVQIDIHDNDIYHAPIATSTANLISLTHGSDALIHHNIFRKYAASATATANAVVIGDASTGFANAIIEHNDIGSDSPNAFDTGVWFRSDSSKAFDRFNRFGTTFNVATVFDQGTNNVKGALSTGAIIGRAYAEYTANADLTVAIPFDGTVPQNTEGTQILSISYTPKSATSRIRLTLAGYGAPATGVAIASAFFIDAGVNAVQATASQGSAGNRFPITMTYEYLPGDTASHTYNVRAGANSGTMRMNGSSTASDFGAAAKTTLVIEEIQG